jgi:hypothetical protein
MKKLVAVATLGLITALGGTAFAQDADKKIGVGGDLQFVLPIGDMADGTGPLIGPVLRGGYRVIPALELTGRIGYLFGLSKSQNVGVGPTSVTVNTSLSDIPIWLGGRYFFMDPSSGLYGAAELALNLMTAKVSDGTSVSNSVTREGFNVGAGYVISKDLPIDIRAQYMMFNLLGKDSGEKTLMGIGLSVGYTFSF